jgi:hypothetical protein
LASLKKKRRKQNKKKKERNGRKERKINKLKEKKRSRCKTHPVLTYVCVVFQPKNIYNRAVVKGKAEPPKGK